MRKRVIDVAGSIGKNTKVYLNGEKLPIKGFSDYVNLYLGNKDPSMRCYEKARGCLRRAALLRAAAADVAARCAGERPLGDLRLRLGGPVPAGASRPRLPAAARADAAPALALLQVSFVNSINTIKGGTHANYIADGVAACVPLRLRRCSCARSV